MEKLDIDEKISKTKKQIEEVLFNMHNKYSLEKFESSSEIYNILKFGETSEQNEEVMEPFIEIYEEFIGLNECYEIGTEDILREYQEIKERLEKMYQK